MKKQNLFIKLVTAVVLAVLCYGNIHAQTVTWYQDSDNDGWGNPFVSTTSAAQPVGYVLNNKDCDDNVFNTTSWNRIGATALVGISAGTATQTALALDASSTPYITYADAGNGNKLVVKKYNATNNQWDTIGPVAFSSASPLSVNIAVSASGTVYVAYQDSANKATVKKYNSATNTWDLVGPSSFTGVQNPLYLTLAVDLTGVPYVSYRDVNTSNKITVRKYNSGTNTWDLVGAAGISTVAATYSKLAFDASGIPYIAYGVSQANVRKYNSGTNTWDLIGPANFSAGNVNYVGLAIDANGVPYVSYQDLGNGNRATVRKYNNTKNQWDTLGTVGFSSGTANYVCLALDAAGIPYVSYQDGGNNSRAAVRKYNATKSQWDTVSTIAFTNGVTTYTSLVVAPQGIPYLAYVDAGSSTFAYVATLKEGNINATTTISATATTIVSGGSVTFTATPFNGGTSPAYQWYKNAVIIPGATSATYTGVFDSTTQVHCRVRSNAVCADQGLYVPSNVIQINVPRKWYADVDADGWGDPANYTLSVTKPAGNWLLNNLDCDDSRFNRDTFNYVGASSFSTGGSSGTPAMYISMAVDYAGTPYVAYQDGDNGGKVSVKKFDGAAWVLVGTAGFSDGVANFVSLAVDGAGVPYVAYKDAVNGNKVTVKKFNGTSWVYVGVPAFSGGISSTVADYPAIAIDAAGTPYVVFKDNISGVSSYATVMKFDGNNWVLVGEKGFSKFQADYTSIAIDPTTNFPYVVYKTGGFSGGASVMKYNGTSWVLVRSPDSSDFQADFTSITVSPQGTPYIFFRDYSSDTTSTYTSVRGTAMKFDGTSWAYMGPQGYKAFTPGDANYTRITTNYSGVPYVVYRDRQQGTSVMRYNGISWDQVGPSRFSGSNVAFDAIAMGPNDVPYVAFQAASSNKVSVMKLNIQQFKASVHVTASSSTVIAGTGITFTATPTNGGSSPSYQWYRNRVAIPGATGATYTSSTLTNQDTITCQVISNDPCVNSAPVPGLDTIIVNVQNYFRTIASGNYKTLGLWEGSPDSTAWSSAYGIPNKGVISIEIRHAINDDRIPVEATVPNFTVSTGNYTAPLQLGVYGNLANNGIFTTTGLVKFVNRSEKTISGTVPVYFYNMMVDDSSSVKIVSNQYLKRLLSFGNTAKLSTGDQFTLLSNATATAGIGIIPSGSDVIGKVYYQRYIPGGLQHRKWRFLGMPLQNQTITSSWQQDIYVTGPGTGGKDCGTDGNMIRNSAGFDQNQTGMNHPTDTALTSTIFSWDEQANVWRGVPSTAAAIDPTKGYRTYIRGDRNVQGCALLTVQPDSTSSVTLHGFGTIIKGNVVKNLTYTAGKGEGYNLLSNPYPCPVSWSSLYNNNDMDNLSATISIINPISGTYAYYNALVGTGTNGGSDQVGSGQSFFVQSMDNIPFTFTENDKSYVPNAGLFGKTAPSSLKIRLTGDDLTDEAVIAQLSDATYGFDKRYDCGKIYNTNTTPDDAVVKQQEVITSIASGTAVNSKPLVFNFTPNTQKTDRLPLYTRIRENAHYTLSFPEMNMQEMYHLYLHDKYTDHYINIREQNALEIQTQSNAASYSETRFELVIINSVGAEDSLMLGTENVMQEQQSQMMLYPVPANETLNIQLNNTSTGTATIAIYDMTGKEVLNREFTLGQQNETVTVSLNDMSAGAYFVKAMINGQPLPARKFIKN